jgi:hypothetical protein
LQGSKLLSLKAPTAVLLNEKKELVSFGYEAENQFSDLLSEDEHQAYFYFLLLYYHEVKKIFFVL